MRTFFFGFLVFCLYAIFARYYYVCEILHLCEETSEIAVVENPRPQTLDLTEGDSILYNEYEQFLFPADSILPTLSQNNIEFLDTIAALLKSDPDKNLSIKGYYLASEQDHKTGIHENLGIARAAAVRNLLLERGIAMERIFLSAAMLDKDLLIEPLTFECTPLEPTDSFYQPDMLRYQWYS